MGEVVKRRELYIHQAKQSLKKLKPEEREQVVLWAIDTWPDMKPTAPLTEHELSVAAMVFYGWSIAEVAENLGIEVCTVHGYMNRVRGKLALAGTSRAEFVEHLGTRGLVDGLRFQYEDADAAE